MLAAYEQARRALRGVCEPNPCGARVEATDSRLSARDVVYVPPLAVCITCFTFQKMSTGKHLTCLPVLIADNCVNYITL